MTWWKKLIGKAWPAQPDRERIERAPRIELTRLQKIGFQRSASQCEVLVFNISETGIGLDRSSFGETALAIDAIIAGEIHFADEAMNVTIRVRRFNDAVVGCSFEDVDPELRVQIHRFFEYELQALKLKRIRDDILKDGGAQQVWFTDGRGNELFLLQQDKVVSHFHMTYLGHYVEGGLSVPTRFGTIAAGSVQPRFPIYKGSDIVSFAETAQSGDIENALRFLSGIQGLEKDLRCTLETLLQK